jgi:hypothetical protein
MTIAAAHGAMIAVGEDRLERIFGLRCSIVRPELMTGAA